MVVLSGSVTFGKVVLSDGVVALSTGMVVVLSGIVVLSGRVTFTSVKSPGIVIFGTV